MPAVRLWLSLDPEDYLPYYTGAAQWVVATAEDGRRVRFPAKALQRHLRPEGIHGRFELQFDSTHRFVALRRVAGHRA